MPGILYLVATPIGNLGDITLRALEVLRQADLIACEDTRHTRKLLAHYGVSVPTTSYHEHNEREKSQQLAQQLEGGVRIALVTDAGMPGISDPGYRLVKLCAERGIPVVPVPGPSALVAALAASGLPTHPFHFFGFPPPRSAARRRLFQQASRWPGTWVFFEAPHRILPCLKDLREALGDRQAVLAREMTKVHEEFLRGPISHLEEELHSRKIRGEMTVLVAGTPGAEPQVPSSPEEHLKEVMERTGLSSKEALKIIARERGVPKRELYRLLMPKER